MNENIIHAYIYIYKRNAKRESNWNKFLLALLATFILQDIYRKSILRFEEHTK